MLHKVFVIIFVSKLYQDSLQVHQFGFNTDKIQLGDQQQL